LHRLKLATKCDVALLRDLPGSRADVAWYPWNWITRPAHHAAMVVTIHDLAPMLQLDHKWWRYYKRWKYRTRFRRTVAAASAILTDSTFTASEVTRHLGVSRDRIRVVLLAADDFIKANDGADVPIDHLVRDGPFFLAVGAHDARKNLELLFDGMARLHAQGESVPLVLCGPARKLSPSSSAGGASWLKWAGYVSDAELATLYRRATALVFPSRYEGFGLPPLEAMSAGGCVVCADASSLPEVTGDAALRFPPGDSEVLARHMTRLLHEPELRASLVARGVQQAARFQWRFTAQQTLEGFEAAIAARQSVSQRR